MAWPPGPGGEKCRPERFLAKAKRSSPEIAAAGVTRYEGFCPRTGTWPGAFWFLPTYLVADEEALLRVFVVAPAAAGDTIPLVRATFHLDGAVAEVVDIEPGSSVIVEALDESALKYSANALIPDSLIRSGLEIVVEIDPDETTDPDLGITARIPETGRMAVDVREMPQLELTLIPFLWSEDPDSAILHITEDLSAADALFWQVNALLPVEDIDLEIHDPVVTDSNSAYALLRRTNAIRRGEGGTGYYMGMMSGEGDGCLRSGICAGLDQFCSA